MPHRKRQILEGKTGDSSRFTFSEYLTQGFIKNLKGMRRMIKISDLRVREVVNIMDGRKLGLIKDIDLDVERGRILSLVLPGPNRFINIFSRREDIVVPWERIVKIGRDVILVEVTPFSEPRRMIE